MRSREFRFLGRLVPSPGSFVALIALGVVLGPGVPAMFSADGDVGRHIRVGREILARHAIPHVDSLSFTLPGGDWIPKEWAAQTAMAAADGFAGLAGVAVLAAIVFSLSVWIIYRIGRCGGAGVGLGMATSILALLLSLTHLLARPHLLTTLLLALETWILICCRVRQRVHPLLLLPVIFTVWANLHGGFPVGLAVAAVFVADAWVGVWRGRLEKSWGIWVSTISFASVLATLINPVGIRLWEHVLMLLSNSYFMSVVIEFQSPDFRMAYGRLLLFTILSTATIVAWCRPRIYFYEGALYLLGLAAVLMSARHITVFSVIAVPWIGVWAARSLGADASGNSRLATRLISLGKSLARVEHRSGPLLPVLIGLLVIAAAAGPFRERARFNPAKFPVEALRAVPPGEMPPELFHENNWGGYILYAFPDIRVFVDGHLDFFGENLVREYLAIRNLAPGWDEYLDRYHINWTLTAPSAAISQALDLSPEWIRSYADRTSVVHVRVSPSQSSVLKPRNNQPNAETSAEQNLSLQAGIEPD